MAKKNWLVRFLEWLFPHAWKDMEMEYIPPMPSLDNDPIVPVEVIKQPVEETLLWDTVEHARHSVRVICDEEGLTVQDKNDLCATVGAESGWQSYYLSGPKKGLPVKFENKKGDLVWSTDWGICQINTYYHIGLGKTFPDYQYVLDNPELCIRWMCKQWKAGHADWWIAYKTQAYKKFL